MPLDIDSKWVFGESTLEMPVEFHRAAIDLLSKIAARSDEPKNIYEDIKTAFGDTNSSSSLSFATSDCGTAMRSELDNAPFYVDCLYRGLEKVAKHSRIPDDVDELIARMLLKANAPVTIQDGEILAIADTTVIDVTETGSDGEEAYGGYQLVKKIGHGGFGVVYEAVRTTSLGEFTYALKRLRTSIFNEKPENALERFAREIEALSKLRHRAIVSYIDAGKDEEGTPFVVMELIQGKDLRRYLSGRSTNEIAQAFISLSEALELAHSQDILHRDIRPSNVLVRESDAQAILLDFGAAYFYENADEKSLTTTLVGSVPYIPPEVIADPKLRTPQQDVYAMGVMLYEVVANSLPRADKIQSLREVGPQYVVFDDVVLSCICPMEQRYRSITEFKEAILRCMDN